MTPLDVVKHEMSAAAGVATAGAAAGATLHAREPYAGTAPRPHVSVKGELQPAVVHDDMFEAWALNEIAVLRIAAELGKPA